MKTKENTNQHDAPTNSETNQESPMGRRRMLTLAGGGTLAALAALDLSPTKVRGQVTTAPLADSLWAPVVGSWLVQVTFSSKNPRVPPELQGKTENTVLTFIPGGGLVASGALSTTAAGQWQVNADGTYTFELAEFVFDPTNLCVTRVTTPTVTFHLDPSLERFIGISGVTTVYTYDPTSEKLLSSSRIITEPGDLDPPEKVLGRRLTVGWVPPNPFPPE
jgi:hypothetical protein